MQSFSESQWRVGIDVIVIDSTSEYFGLVGSVVRISTREKAVRCSVNFDGDVYGFEKDDLQIATL